MGTTVVVSCGAHGCSNASDVEASNRSMVNKDDARGMDDIASETGEAAGADGLVLGPVGRQEEKNEP